MSRNRKQETVAGSVPQWRLMWRRFRRHRLAFFSLWVLCLMYGSALFCEFVAPYGRDQRNADMVLSPPQRPRFIDRDGRIHLRPFVYPLNRIVAEDGYRWTWKADTSRRLPLYLFERGYRYKLWGIFPGDIHLFGTRDGRAYLFGTDRNGACLFSRILYGARISLTIGLLGVAITFLLGITLGGLAGFYGGIIDHVIQRGIEIIRCVPTLPLWMTLSAALPASWPPLRIYFGITIIMSFISWTGLARVIRGKFLSLREEDFVVAAQVCGTNELTIIFKHMLPSSMSHVIASATLAIPGMILGEAALSFLGIGLRAPVVSWGVLLQHAQNYQAVSLAPWLLLPGVFVIVVVMAFNLVGDGLRDAADPYANM